LFILLTWFSSGVFAQDYELRYDTVVTKKTKIMKLVTVRNRPSFILHLDGGYSTGAMELSSPNGGFNKQDLISGKNYAARNGFSFNLIGKIPLDKQGKFWIDISTGFDRFKSNLATENDEEGEIAYNNINGGVGVEYNFTATHKVKYFIGTTMLLSSISGSGRLAISQDNNVIDVDIKGGMRLGYNVFVGLEYAVSNKFGLNLGFKFTHANLLLKNSEAGVQFEEGASVYETELNDDAVPQMEDPILFAGWKQFAYFTGSAGISYFFGVKDRRYKLSEKKLN
jgi:opacity protein-like surface antigen